MGFKRSLVRIQSPRLSKRMGRQPETTVILDYSSILIVIIGLFPNNQSYSVDYSLS
jgi:hypothetical protein